MEVQAGTNVNIVNNYYGQDAANSVDFSKMSMREILDFLAEMTEGPDGIAPESAAGAIANSAGEALVDIMKDQINADDSIPQAKKDEMINTIEEAEQENGLDTPSEIQDLMAELKAKFKEEMQEILEEEIKETAEGTGGEAGGSEGKEGAGGAGGAGRRSTLDGRTV